jgi:hypothetical protein
MEVKRQALLPEQQQLGRASTPTGKSSIHPSLDFVKYKLKKGIIVIFCILNTKGQLLTIFMA